MHEIRKVPKDFLSMEMCTKKGFVLYIKVMGVSLMGHCYLGVEFSKYLKGAAGGL